MKAKKHLNLDLRIPLWWPDGTGWRRVARALVPNPGTLIILGVFLLAQSAGALPLRIPATVSSSTTTISYQGRLADSAGNPITTSGLGMQFCLYDTDVDGSPEWCEDHPSVPVEDGLFSVLLGSRSGGIPIEILTSNPTLWLGIAVGSDSEMTPREQIASAPYAMLARIVPDGSITTAKIADGAVTESKLDPNWRTDITRGFTPTVYSDHVSPSEGLHRWPESGQSRTNIAFKVPDDYVSGDLTVRQTFYEHDTIAGTVAKMSRTIARYRKSDGVSTPISSETADYTYGSGFRTFTIPAGSFEAGDLIRIVEIRDGDDPADTAGRLDLLAVGIEYMGK